MEDKATAAGESDGTVVTATKAEMRGANDTASTAQTGVGGANSGLGAADSSTASTAQTGISNADSAHEAADGGTASTAQASVGIANNVQKSADSSAATTAQATVGIASAARAHGIPAERVISRTESAVELSVRIPAASDYFDGHFPEFKLLPAVAQIDLVTDYARAYFGTSKAVRGIKRCKFIAPLLPDTDVRFSLSFSAESAADAPAAYATSPRTADDGTKAAPAAAGACAIGKPDRAGTLTFKITNSASGAAYASGTLRL